MLNLLLENDLDASSKASFDRMYFIVIKLTSSFRRRYTWEVWDTVCDRPIEMSYQRFCSFQDAFAAASASASRRRLAFSRETILMSRHLVVA